MTRSEIDRLEDAVMDCFTDSGPMNERDFQIRRRIANVFEVLRHLKRPKTPRFTEDACLRPQGP